MRTDICMLLDNPLRSDQRVEKEAKSLSDHGLSVVIVATNEDESLETYEDRDGYHVRRVLSKAFKHPLRRSYRQWLEESLEVVLEHDFRVLHCHDFALLPLAVAIKEKRPELFLTYDSHEYLAGWPYYKEIPNLWNRIKGYFVWKRYLRNERRAGQHLNAMICPSKMIADRQRDRLETSLSPLVIRNIPSEGNQLTSANLREELGLNQDDLIFVHAGNIHASDQDMDRLVKAVLENDQCHVLFIGNRPRFYELKKRWESSERTHFLKYEPDTLLSTLAQCTFGIALTETRYLAHRIGSSNRIMEYTKAGLPVLASEQESHMEMQDNYGHLILIDTKDQESIESGVKTIIEKKDELAKKADQAGSQLSWDREVRPLILLYRSIVRS